MMRELQYNDNLPMTCDNRPGVVQDKRIRSHYWSVDLTDIPKLTDKQKEFTLDHIDENSPGHKKAKAVIDAAIAAVRQARLDAMAEDGWNEEEEKRLARDRMRRRRDRLDIN